MKTLSRTGLAALLLSLLAIQTVAAESIKVGIAAEPYPPFASPDASGNWTGWELEIIDAVCGAAKLDCVITPVAWDGIIPALTTKKIDVIMASMSITPERMKTIDFSDKYYNTPAVIVAPKSLEMDATPASMKDKILGIQAGTIHRDYVAKHFASEAAEIKEYQTQDEANQDLVAGRIDATQADSLAMVDFVKSEQGMTCCEVKGNVAADLEILGPGVGAGLRKGEDELKAKINAAIAMIRENGQYAEISKNYFDFDVYGE